MESNDGLLRPASSQLTLTDHVDHLLARLAWNRMGHVVQPGLYALGQPTPDSDVFVTANYTLSFDALRSTLAGRDAYILVLDTKGVNVWCAAGKGSFGTEELVRRIAATRLADVVRQRVLILPQLGAPGVAAHEVKKLTGFRVEYGPVRAADLPEYVKSHQATPEMRRVRFTLRDRLTLIPVELVGALLPLLLVGLLLRSRPAVYAILAGVVLFPILLPWIPTKDLSTKGFILGLAVAVPLTISRLARIAGAALWVQALWAACFLLVYPPVTAFLALNFTGTTTFTSRSGVRREIFAYAPLMAWSFGIGLLLNIALILIPRLSGA